MKKLIFTLFLLSGLLFGQDQNSVLLGFGLPELLNVGINFQKEQSQYGIRVGSFPADEKILTIRGDYYYHFAGKSAYASRRPWYGRLGLNYLRDETEKVIDLYWYLDLRIGREFYLSPSLGIAIDAGIAVQISHEKEVKNQSNYWDIIPEIPVLPGLGITLFYGMDAENTGE